MPSFPSVLILVLIACELGFSNETTNVITNPSFEAAGEGWVVAGCDQLPGGKAEWRTEQDITYFRALMTNSAGCVQLLQEIVLPQASRRFVYRARVRAEVGEKWPAQGWSGLKTELSATREDGSRVDFPDPTSQVPVDGRWHLIDETLESDQPVSRFYLIIGLVGNTGNADFTGLQLLPDLER